MGVAGRRTWVRRLARPRHAGGVPTDPGPHGDDREHTTTAAPAQPHQLGWRRRGGVLPIVAVGTWVRRDSSCVARACEPTDPRPSSGDAHGPRLSRPEEPRYTHCDIFNHVFYTPRATWPPG